VKNRLTVLVFGFSISVDGKTIAADGKAINLRRELMKNNIDVYPLKAKITGNCGGAGICGTCAVKILSGSENLSPPSANEQRVLQENKRGPDIRLSCCTKVSGNVSLRTKP
jgi:ferredoxin